MTTTKQQGRLTIPVPEGCSERYAAGWAFADNHVNSGGNLHAEAPDGWSEEKAIGFWDRLATQRRELTNEPTQAD